MYYTIHDFMTKDLQLKGTDLNVFALIYSFKEYKGSLSSICSAVGAKSITTIQYSLKRLSDMGLIMKSKPDNKFSTCTYKVDKNNDLIPNRTRGRKEHDWSQDEQNCKIGEWEI